MIAPMKSRSISKLGHLGLKTRSPGQIKENIVSTLEVPFFQTIVMNLAQNVCLDDF